MIYEVFKSLPHQSITITPNNKVESFELYQCGIFQNHLYQENVEFVELPPDKTYTPHYHKNVMHPANTGPSSC